MAKKSSVDIHQPVPENQKRFIAVPSGPCPVQLEGLDAESLDDWAEAVRAAFSKVRISNGALRQFARQFYVYSSDEHCQIRLHFRGQ